MFNKFSKAIKWLIISLLVVVVASLSASLVQNSFFSVNVSNLTIETEVGEISGVLYMPKDVDDSNPAPTVIFTHGYLNNKEMQEIGAIELSKRGYVVLTIDMYGHGDSIWTTDEHTSYYAISLYDAAQYMYDQDYVLKDADGNGMIGVSGHSMGGFSAASAVGKDEADFAVNGYRKISVALVVGAEVYSVNDMQTRSIGIIAAHYDQFFFDSTGTIEGGVHFKDYVKDPRGLAFLGRTDIGTAEENVWYDLDGGQRVIYTPDETHPQNTWSLETGKDTIEFFERAFNYQLDLSNLEDLETLGITTGTTGQTWWIKEGFTLVAIIGLVMFMISVFSVLSGLPVLNKVNMKFEEATSGFRVRPKEKNITKIGVLILATLISANYIEIFMSRKTEGLEALAKTVQNIALVAILVIILVWIGTIIVKGATGGEKPEMDKLAGKTTVYGGIVVLISVCFRWFLLNPGLFRISDKWGAPSTNTIIYWAIASAGLILLITVITSLYFNQGEDVKNPFGLKTTPIQFVASILNAIVMVIAVLLVVAVTAWIFKTDFRFYTFAIQIFNGHQFALAMKYIPGFLVYYFAAGISVFVNTRNMKKAWLADIYAAFLLAGPIILFLIYNYRTLYTTGIAAYPTFSLSAILTVGLVPVLSIAAIVMRRISLKTGNIWTGVFFTATFFTIITLANTYISNFIG